MEAKILAVADVVDAIVSHRPYRPALGKGVAIDELKQNSGIKYDTEIAAACLGLLQNGEIDAIYQKPGPKLATA